MCLHVTRERRYSPIQTLQPCNNQSLVGDASAYFWGTLASIELLVARFGRTITDYYWLTTTDYYRLLPTIIAD